MDRQAVFCAIQKSDTSNRFRAKNVREHVNERHINCCLKDFGNFDDEIILVRAADKTELELQLRYFRRAVIVMKRYGQQ